MTKRPDNDPRRIARAAYYAAHRDEARAANHAWREANPERSRELNRLSMQRRARKQKSAEQRRARAREKYANNPEPERERLRRFHAANPEKAAQYQRRFKERHPERAAEQARRGSQAWRDRNAETAREVQRQQAAQRRQEDPDTFRRWYAANLEREREKSREKSRLRSRLKKLGLPPPHRHRVYAEQKRANLAAAHTFFTRRRNAPERARTTRELTEPQALSHALTAHRRRRQLASGVPTLAEQDRTLARLPALVNEHQRRHGDAIREEIRMDSVARQLRGKPALEIDTETANRAWEEVIRREAAALPKERLDQLHKLLAPPSDLPAHAPSMEQLPNLPHTAIEVDRER